MVFFIINKELQMTVFHVFFYIPVKIEKWVYVLLFLYRIKIKVLFIIMFSFAILLLYFHYYERTVSGSINHEEVMGLLLTMRTPVNNFFPLRPLPFSNNISPPFLFLFSFYKKRIFFYCKKQNIYLIIWNLQLTCDIQKVH